MKRADFDAVVDMLSEGIATRRGRAGTRLHRDAVNRRLKGRRGARITALTSGGAIPDNANYDVVLEPDETLIGSVDEDFAVESMAGDVMLLGNTSWRIRRVESGKVRVEDAGGAAPTIPFWLGEGPARTLELSAEVATLRDEVDAPARRPGQRHTMAHGRVRPRRARGGPRPRLHRRGVRGARRHAHPRHHRGRALLRRGGRPAARHPRAVRGPDQPRVGHGAPQAHLPELRLRAAGRGHRRRVLLSLGPQHSFPLESVFQMVHPSGLDQLLTDAALQAPMFATRWRWNATRSLALTRWQGGRRVPPYLQRMRAEDLLASVFPEQLGCQDNAVGPIEIPDHPLVNETLRDCLTEAMDAKGLKERLQALFRGRSGRWRGRRRSRPCSPTRS